MEVTMPDAPVIRLADLTRDEIGRLAPDAVALVPLGAIEQHGPHLPVGVDYRLVTSIAEAAAERVAGTVRVLVAPPLPYGLSGHHRPHPGVLTLTAPTLIAVLTEVLESLIASGFTRMAIINGHNGNSEVIGIVARDINNRFPVTVSGASYWSMAAPHLDETLWKEGHAGESETALMMHVQPGAVQYPLPPASNHRASVKVGTARIFLAERRTGLSSGYTDAPANASAKLGSRTFEACVAGVCEFLEQDHRVHGA
jgi:creatinine amidohydrolase